MHCDDDSTIFAVQRQQLLAAETRRQGHLCYNLQPLVNHISRRIEDVAVGQSVRLLSADVLQ